MATKYVYSDGETYTPCKTRKQALAFLIAQNGGVVDVMKKGIRYPIAEILNSGHLSVRRTANAPVSWFEITPEMREEAQKTISSLGSSTRKYYEIDFVYNDNNQQFGTGADLTTKEFSKLEAYLEKLANEGYITDWHIHEPFKPAHQTFAQARKEIADAIRS